MLVQIYTIARFTYLEALRSRLALLLVVGVFGLLGFAEFAKSVSIAEADANRLAVFAASVRWFLAFVVSLFVATSMVREMNDKVLDMTLSLPITRSVYYAGKLAGYGAVAISSALMVGVLLLMFAPINLVALWTLSLICELILLVALTLLCLFTLNQVTLAVTAVLAFYVLSRSIDAIQLIGHSPLVEKASIANEFIARAVDAMAYLLPSLGRFGHSEWLVHGVGWDALTPVLAQTAVYTVLLTGAALFDLHRKNL
jgi:Cu-processing system permease protein